MVRNVRCVKMASPASRLRGQNTRVTIVAQRQWNAVLMYHFNEFENSILVLEFTPRGMIKKREGICHVFRIALHKSRIGVWKQKNSHIGLMVMSLHANPPRCVMPF